MPDPREDFKVVVDTNLRQTVPSVAIGHSTPSQNTQNNHHTTPVTVIKGATTFVLDFLETIVVALSIFVVVYLFLVQPHEVKGSSMEPTFHNNEYILTDKISYRLQNPHRGDVVIFKAPRNPDVDYIKRIIALPGETVRVEKGKVYVGEEELNEPYLTDTTILFPGSVVQEGVPLTVGAEEYFVMGDNRSHSSDSREFGPIERKSIIGRAFLRYWPPPVFGLIPAIAYQIHPVSGKVP